MKDSSSFEYVPAYKAAFRELIVSLSEHDFGCFIQGQGWRVSKSPSLPSFSCRVNKVDKDGSPVGEYKVFIAENVHGLAEMLQQYLFNSEHYEGIRPIPSKTQFYKLA